AEALFFGISIAIISLVWRWLADLPLGGFKNLGIALAIGAIYTGREFFAGRFPYGGLPWARIGLSQVENSLAKWVWALDISGLSWLLVTLTALAALRFLSPLPSGSGLKLRLRAWTPVISSWVVISAIAFFVPLPSGEEVGKLRVAAVQGNVNAGLFAINPPGSIMEKHLAVSRELLASPRATGLRTLQILTQSTCLNQR
ncbi:MAG: hypothetical protein EBR26_06670, partial [Microbacteriaceae bacterium]|nr:hypothetical protein [Microbacteriaceae bacterium]